MIAININWTQTTGIGRSRFDPVITQPDISAHFPQHIDKPKVALETALPYPFHPDRACADNASSKKVRSGGCVPLDQYLSGAVIALAAPQSETSPFVTLDLH